MERSLQELGSVRREYRVSAAGDLRMGTGFVVFGLIIVLIFFAGWLGDFLLLFGGLALLLGIGIAIASFIQRNNRLIVHEHGVTQQYAWRTESYKWSDMDGIEALEHHHYS